METNTFPTGGSLHESNPITIYSTEKYNEVLEAVKSSKPLNSPQASCEKIEILDRRDVRLKKVKALWRKTYNDRVAVAQTIQDSLAAKEENRERELRTILNNITDSSSDYSKIKEFLDHVEQENRKNQADRYKKWQTEVYEPVKDRIASVSNFNRTERKKHRQDQYQKYIDTTNAKLIFRDIQADEYDPFDWESEHKLQYEVSDLKDPLHKDLVKAMKESGFDRTYSKDIKQGRSISYKTLRTVEKLPRNAQSQIFKHTTKYTYPTEEWQPLMTQDLLKDERLLHRCREGINPMGSKSMLFKTMGPSPLPNHFGNYKDTQEPKS